MHQHTKFGKKWLSGSGDTEQTHGQYYSWKDGQSESNILHPHPIPHAYTYMGAGSREGVGVIKKNHFVNQ